MDRAHDRDLEHLLGTLSMAWCTPLLLEWTTCGHSVMGILEEARPNPVLLVRIVLHDHFLIGSNIAPGILIHQMVNRPTTNRNPRQYHELKRQTPKMGAHIPEYLLFPANRVDYQLASLPRFASTPSMSEAENCISKPHRRTILRPQPRVHSLMGQTWRAIRRLLILPLLSLRHKARPAIYL
jgi:hypothetical protein